MRIIFSVMHLFNDNLYSTRDIFNIEQKKVGSRQDGERVRCGVWVEKGRGVGHKLDRGSLFMRV
jgi:hypothetical protein